jgi:hydroxymethylpyrimidine pyrophosphatase-like HAD family hydrolase
VPHPYHSGLGHTVRASYVHQLETLMKSNHVACVTGRTFEGWKNLFTQADRDPHFPRLAALAFGAEIYFHGKLLGKKHISAEMSQLIQELKSELSKHHEFDKQTDFTGMQRFGRLNGFFIEEKTSITQIDWNFQTEATNLKFAELVFQILNPHLAKRAALKCQVFHKRIDILSHGFVPKAGLSEHVHQWVNETRAESGKPLCYVFGDELYDDYLFESIKSLEGKTFQKVETIGVQNGSAISFKHADRVLKDPEEVWRFIQSTG